MRKLNKKNKTIIVILSSLVLCFFIGMFIFITYKIKDVSIKYDVNESSFVYNNENELYEVKSNSFVKKNFLGTYYLHHDKEVINLGKNPVFFTKRDASIKMFGNFYEVGDGGKVTKLKGETDITNCDTGRVFKISDRKYLLLGNTIYTDDSSIEAKYYLHVNIDKKGNGYLFNNEINSKSFSSLVLKTNDYVFNVNEEKVIINNEEINLAKILGSSNEYVKEEVPEEEIDSSGNGSGLEADSNATSNKKEPIIQTEVIKDVITENKYLGKKTTIYDVEGDATSLTISYIIFDPHNEYESLGYQVYQGDGVVASGNLDVNANSVVVKNLNSDTSYRVDFYYIYGGGKQVLFDSVYAATSKIKSSISLDKVTNNSVEYKVIIGSKEPLDSGVLNLYTESGTLLASQDLSLLEVNKKGEFVGKFGVEGLMSGVYIIKLENCVYRGMNLNIDASYKFKM